MMMYSLSFQCFCYGYKSIDEAIKRNHMSIQIYVDTSKEDELAATKASWLLNEPDRFERGKVLRDAFLEEHAVVLTASINSDLEVSTDSLGFPVVKSSDGSQPCVMTSTLRRSSKPQPNPNCLLPKLDLSRYMEMEEEEENPWVKTEFDEETLRNQRAMDIIDFENSQTRLIQKYQLVLQDQRRKYKRLFQEFELNYSRGQERVEEAYKMRQDYLESLKVDGRRKTSAKKGSKK